MFQSDRLSKISLPPQEVNSKPLPSENNRKKLILHCFRRPQKNNFKQEQRPRFQPIRKRARSELNQSESTLEMKDCRRPFSQFVRFSISKFISLICFNFPKVPSIKDVRKNLPFFDPPPPRPGVSEITDHPPPPPGRPHLNFLQFQPKFCPREQ